jgi:hypothetical protein
LSLGGAITPPLDLVIVALKYLSIESGTVDGDGGVPEPVTDDMEAEERSAAGPKERYCET